MHMYMRRLAALLLALLMTGAPAFFPAQAAELPPASPEAAVAASAAPVNLTAVRVGLSSASVRLVLDLSGSVKYKVFRLSDPERLVLDLTGAVNRTGVTSITVNDPVVTKVRLGQAGTETLRLVVDLSAAAPYKVFALTNPDRLVLDIAKVYESKVSREVRPGLLYTAINRGTPAGPVRINAITLDQPQNWMIRPMLSNDAVAGLETVSAMAARDGAVAAVNATYFAPNGEIIGLLKLDDTIVSTPLLARTAYGQDTAGRGFFAQAAYEGAAVLPGGRSVSINGVNRERGANELIVFNHYYGARTGSNGYGQEYTVQDGHVVAVGIGNVPIPARGYVLSAHGQAAQALSVLRIGDAVTLRQTLGPALDQAVYAVGAGPTLVKNGQIYLTTTQEEFPPDIAVGRAPRTALGLRQDGGAILAVVDGRRAGSIGMSLPELAALMRELGAVDAMNLDGGGSSDMVIEGRVVNSPADGRERKVGTALGVFPAAAGPSVNAHLAKPGS